MTRHFVMNLLIFVTIFAACECRIIKRDVEPSRFYNADLDLYIKGIIERIDECLRPVWKTLEQTKPKDKPQVKNNVHSFLRERTLQAMKPQKPIPNKTEKPEKAAKPGVDDVENLENPLSIDDESSNSSLGSNSSSSSSESSSESDEDYEASTPFHIEVNIFEDAGFYIIETEEKSSEEDTVDEEFLESEPVKDESQEKYEEDGFTEAY